MRTWTLKNGQQFTETELLNSEFRYSIADGTSVYKIKKIRKQGHDPIVELTKIENHPDNPDNYGLPEKLDRVSGLIRILSFERIFGAHFAEAQAKKAKV